jgi:hypothetical protein
LEAFEAHFFHVLIKIPVLMDFVNNNGAPVNDRSTQKQGHFIAAGYEVIAIDHSGLVRLFSSKRNPSRFLKVLICLGVHCFTMRLH